MHLILTLSICYEFRTKLRNVEGIITYSLGEDYCPYDFWEDSAEDTEETNSSDKTENYTEEICNAFPYLCKVKYEKLLSNKYIKKDLRNPLTDKKMSDDTKSFIEIKWKDGKMICTHKEG